MHLDIERDKNESIQMGFGYQQLSSSIHERRVQKMLATNVAKLINIPCAWCSSAES